MAGNRYPRALIVFSLLGGAVGFAVALTGSALTGLIAGLVTFAMGFGLAVVRTRGPRVASGPPKDPSRRRFLLTTGAGGLAAAIGGPALGRSVRQSTRPDPIAVQDAMAHGLGAEYMEILRRTYRPGRSGELQLLLAPFNSANYSFESTSLVPLDPRSSHASVWMYLERIPLVIHAPGRERAQTRNERVTLADIAPTIADMMGFQDFLDLGRDGKPLPGITRPKTPPKVAVTFVIDGGGWNVLQTWPDAWPNLKRLMAAGVNYTDAINGSFPAVTACAHATIGTGAYPYVHGITGHNIRDDAGTVRKAYGVAGNAQPSDILIPTLADLWSEKTNNQTWVGELGYQVWHLGMLGRGGPTRTADQKPVAVFWDEDLALARTEMWQPQNPDLYRLPTGAPGPETLSGYQAAYTPPQGDVQQIPLSNKQSVCCSPPIVKYLGDLVDATLRNEQVGRTGTTDLLFINYKMPDYTGHIYNMLSDQERVVFEEVDAQLGRLVATLDELFPSDYALFVTADHGQCPLPDSVNGVRLDPLQIQDDIESEFGGIIPVVDYVAPSEIFLHDELLKLSGASANDVATWLRDYRYRSNIGPYVPRDAIEYNLLNQLEFAGVFGDAFLRSLASKDLAAYGDTAFPGGDLRGFADLTNPYPWD